MLIFSRTTSLTLRVVIGAFALGLILPARSLGCEIATEGGSSRPQSIRHQAWIKTSSGITYGCTVESYRLYHASWDLKCANGSSISIGSEVDCPSAERGLCTATFVKDRDGQQFQMREELEDGWRQLTCMKGIASRTFSIRLKQESFYFDSIVIESFRQKTIKPPVGF